MDINRLSQYRLHFIFVFIAFFMVFCVWIRGLSAESIDLSRYLTYESPDIWYNFRQLEIVVHNFPGYAWFDPMTAYPNGKTIGWGPLMPLIGSVICLLTGMTTRFELMYVASWIPPVFAALTVPVVYLLGNRLWNYKAGLVAAGLVTILSSMYFVDTSFGYFDHHCIETFASTLFCVMYIITLLYAKKYHEQFKNSQNILIFIALAVLTAVSYFLGYMNMPTIILFGLIVAIYTFFQYIADGHRNELVNYLLYTNLAVFTLVLIMMAVFGVKEAGMALQQYGIAQILAILLILIETLVFFGLAHYLGKNTRNFFISVILSAAAFFVLLYLATNGGFITELVNFFGQVPGASTIRELKGWSLELAFNSFYFALVLGILGFAILVRQFARDVRSEHLFFITWTLVVFFATVGHYRYEYYFVVNVSLLSALGIVSGIQLGLDYLGSDGLRGLFARKKEEEPATPPREEKGRKRKKAKRLDRGEKTKRSSNRQFLGGIILVAILVMTAYTVTAAIQKDMKYSTLPADLRLDSNWVESMEWLSLHTPDPGVGYLTIYEKDVFEYPSESYGIMSWWDYGHYITFIGKRIPIANPFQDNVRGANGVASFLFTDSEEEATRILERRGGRYVITDSSSATDKFSAILGWYDPDRTVTDYVRSFFRETSDGTRQINVEMPPYYETTLVRLHNFDGSMMVPDQIILMEYYNENRGGMAYPMIVNAWLLTPQEAADALAQYIPRPETDVLKGGQFLYPLVEVPAMRHFRLVHESPGNATDLLIHDMSGIESIPAVKIFETVPGARIQGEGTLELEIMTNTGRTFTYRQESIDGEFIVPYATVDNPYEVVAVGKYRIIETGKEFDVSDDDVMSGRRVGI